MSRQRVTSSVHGAALMVLLMLAAAFMAASPAGVSYADAPGNGLLFYASGEKGPNADYAQGDPVPNYVYQIETIADGAKGKAFQCGNDQLLAWDAPGNIYAQRGTLSFFWRGRLPIGETPFPIFRVSYSDHSSWDLVWLRIDWNGTGFEGFVTDANLARPRLKYTVDSVPAPETWVHLAMSWDENQGMRFYVNGRMVAKKDTTAVLYAGLDQFGPHSRIISPYQVQSLYNFVRGGDVDEIAIFDHMLNDSEVASLAKGSSPASIETRPVVRSMDNPAFRDEWLLRYGFNRKGDLPPYLASASTRVRKVTPVEAYDVKQWVYKGIDGIRETTWPYVYNFSHIIGRRDYFVLPDWNCYSISGSTVTFTMPDEPWNHIEISGAAYGSLKLLDFDRAHAKDSITDLGTRPRDQERTFLRTKTEYTGGKIQFTNVVRETPIGEFMVYDVNPGMEPAGTATLTYSLRGNVRRDNTSIQSLLSYIDGRYMEDERNIMVAMPGGAPSYEGAVSNTGTMPIVHVLVPFEFRNGKQNGAYNRFSYTWENMHDGLDGIAIDIPALDVKPLENGLFPMNIRICDPIWPDRVLFDFTFSVKPGEARTLWMDTRDRILPNGYSLYLTIAGAGGDFNASDLEGARIRLVFKDRTVARIEHETDRFNEVKDNVGNLVEEHPNQKKLRMYARYSEEITDLLRVNPDHELGRLYWSVKNSEQGWPPFKQPEAPAGIPLWAFRQIENLRICDAVYTWWMDKRQIENGEFGGGLSDDGDMTNQFPGPALMGIKPEKYTESVHRLLGAYYAQGLFTNGLSTIVADELHSYEEGIDVLPQAMLLDYGNPETVERMMETAAAYERITGINDKGFRQVKSLYFGGEKVYSEGVWAKSRPYSCLVMHPGLSLVEFNGHPATRKLILEIADGILSTEKKSPDGRISITAEILYPSGEGVGNSLGAGADVLWAAWCWTGDRKYLEPLVSEGDRGNFGMLNTLNTDLMDQAGRRKTWGPKIAESTSPLSGSTVYRHVAWQVTGNKQYLEEYYGDLIRTNSQNQYMSTEGHWWIDRIYAQHKELQRSRLGGVALWRNNLYPGHYISWNIEEPATWESIAVLVPEATSTHLTVQVYNTETVPVTAAMTGWNIDPGMWEMTQGVDGNGDDMIDGKAEKKQVEFERTKDIVLTFPPRTTTIVTLDLKKKGLPYWKRPDLGISKKDVTVRGTTARVVVHSIGSVDAPAAKVNLVASDGEVLASADIPSLKAPLDFKPKTAAVDLTAPAGTGMHDLTVSIVTDDKLPEITTKNNTVTIP